MLKSRKKNTKGGIVMYIPFQDLTQGGAFLVILAILLRKVIRRPEHIARRLLGLIFIFQVGYILSRTELDRYLHLSSFFRTNLLASIAVIFYGTPLYDLLIKADATFTNALLSAVNLLYDTVTNLPSLFL